MKYFLIAALATIALAISVQYAMGQDVKYCINHETGQIITVAAGMPCPWPMADY